MNCLNVVAPRKLPSTVCNCLHIQLPLCTLLVLDFYSLPIGVRYSSFLRTLVTSIDEPRKASSLAEEPHIDSAITDGRILLELRELSCSVLRTRYQILTIFCAAR